MDETELSKMLDLILSGSLQKPAVEAMLITSSGALLHDSRLVQSACRADPKFHAVWKEWALLCNRILASYDQVLTYFDVLDQDILESAFETTSVSLYEKSKLLGLIPHHLRPVLEEKPFWEQELELIQVAALDHLESLMGRKAEGALERYVNRLIQEFRQVDAAILEELDEDEAEAYDESSNKLFGKMLSLCRQGTPEERQILLGVVAELMEERLTFQEELLAESDC